MNEAGKNGNSVNTGSTSEIHRTSPSSIPSDIKKAVQSDKIDMHPAFDQYIPENSNEQNTYGHYKVVSDKNGNQKIQFSDPGNKTYENTRETPKTAVPEKDNAKNNKNSQILKNKRQQIKQQIITETDPQKAKLLKKKLAQIERQLKTKV